MRDDILKNGKTVKNAEILVIAGGVSREREISLESGRSVFKALRSVGFKVTFMDLVSLQDLYEKKREKRQAAFITLHGGYGEDGTVQKILEEKRIPYTGSGPLASLLAMDKIRSKEVFQEIGLKVPAWETIRRDRAKMPEVGFPCVIKPAQEGSSFGLSVARDLKEYERAIGSLSSFEGEIIAEEFIQGREMTVGILKDEALPVIEIFVAQDVYDFGAKYSSELTAYKVPAQITREVQKKLQKSAMRAHQGLGCRCFSRADFRLDKNNVPYLLEVNTIPGLTKRSLLPKAASVAGVDFTELCVKMIEDCFEVCCNKVMT